MKLIAHRGNYQGIQSENENDPKYLLEALNKGYDVELDVWGMGENIWFGHDRPKHQPNYEKLMKLVSNPGVWWHSKNYEALVYLLKTWPHLKVFSHSSDAFGIVTGGYIWTEHSIFPVSSNKTVVMIAAPSKWVLQRVWDENKVYGMCCDDFQELER